MSHSSATDIRKVPQTTCTSSTASSTKSNDGLSANAPAFVPRSISSEGHEQVHSRTNQGGRGRGRQDRGGLSHAFHSDRLHNEHHQQQHQQSRHRGRGADRHRPHGQRVQEQPASELRGQQQKQQHTQEPHHADSAVQAAASNLERSSNRPSSAARGRSMAANHLLNFQYDTMRVGRGGRSSTGSRGGGGGGAGSSTARRRYPAPRPQRYDKQKFLQANFRFLVSSTLDRRQFESDADRMFDWDDVLLVDMMSSTPIQCPISLDSPPSCPQITPCGHVYSFGSIMQHLMNHGGEQLRRSAPCPLCYQPVVARELRLVQVRQVAGVPSVGSNVTFQLLCRPRTSIIPSAVTKTAAAADEEEDVTTMQAAMPATALSKTGVIASIKWKNKGPSALISNAAMETTAKSQQNELPTALSDNLYAKFATCLDPRPLWRASAQQLGQQLALVLSQGGMEAEMEAPALFAAADSLANRARRFGEHQVNQLQQRGVPGSSCSATVGSTDAAGGAGSSGWPVWLKDDAHAAGHDAEQLVRDAFTLALDGSKAALVAKEQQQQVEQRIQQEFPELTAVAPPPRAAGLAASAASAPPAAVVEGVSPTASQQPPPVHESADDASDHPAAELCFDHAFSEDEEMDNQLQQEQQQGEDSANAAAAEDDSNSHESIGRTAAGRSAGSNTAAGASTILGSSPSANAVLGSSPNTSMMNSANQSGDYYMYQSSDGQWVFLHPLNLRCLLHAYGSYASCPSTVTGKLLEIEDVVQDESSRRRWKFLGHLPLNGTFRLAEVQLLDPALTADQLAPFAEELAGREKRRKRRADAAKRESKREAAAAAAAQKAKQGPTAAELRAMPRLGSTQGPAGAGEGVDIGVNFAGLSVEQLDEALAAQAMHDSALSGVASPPTGGVSFAKMTKLGFAASGPALGTNASPGGLSDEGLGPAAAAAAPAALRGAWGAGTAGQSAAAKLGGQVSGQKSAWGAGSSNATVQQQPAGVLSNSSWGAAGRTGEGASSSNTTATANWLILGGGAAGAATTAATSATGSQEAGPADGSVSAPASASKKGKKEKKGQQLLFTTGAQRRY